MKKIFVALMTILGLLPVQVQAITPLIIGQSNPAGRAPIEEGDETRTPGVWILNNTRFMPARGPLNIYSTIRKEDVVQKMSFVNELFRLMAEDYTVYGVVQARGGSTIECWTKGGFCYDETVKLVQQNNLKIDIIIIHLGESSRDDDKFHVKISRTIQNLREDLGVPDCPVIIGEIAPYDAEAVAFNRRLWKVPGIVPNVAVVDSAGLTTIGPWHFDNWSCRELGMRYYEEFLRIY